MMTKAENLILAYMVAVGVFSADLVRFLGWHWLAWWPIFAWSFFCLAFIGGFVGAATEAFVRGFKRGFKRGRGK